MENNKNHSDKVDFSLEIGPEKPPTNESSTNQNSESSTNANTPQSRDEITKFQNARYISASEAIWRIFNFKNHDQHPLTERLPVHLENGQTVFFSGNEPITEVLEKNTETPLTHFFKLNSTNEDVRKINYWQMPQFYRWNLDKKIWTKRVKYI